MAAVIIDEIHMSDRFMNAAPLSMYNPSTENNSLYTLIVSPVIIIHSRGISVCV